MQLLCITVDVIAISHETESATIRDEIPDGMIVDRLTRRSISNDMQLVCSVDVLKTYTLRQTNSPFMSIHFLK